MQPRTPRVQIGSRQRAAMAGLAAAFTAATLAAMAHATTTGSPPLSPSSQPWSSSYYAAVENRLSAGGGMLLVCRALGGNIFTQWSVVPRGRVPRDGRRVLELLVDAKTYGWVTCSWAYQGNYVGAMPLFDSRWPEAKRCQDVAGGGLCRVVFESDMVRLETPGGGQRVLGDLPVKRCRRHWLLFSTECTYPDHPHPYAGRRLSNAFEYFGV
ncbi:hypothetical protein CFC21_071284 [Triticum aestivum]|uniref:DUF7771 domain-containing protein n=3 Tax=Triticum TaxID=4564 RepID=A0A9R0X7M3_TRITD|nr:uncharacterized protein LOC119305789 [Triticum dicoccoides]XP_044392997.1 uncharacterized protein LOC123116056 [Triticum aestivum]KAF7065125.1 hypothetical protein CFC21_071284 [Triticum aestivum]VAI31431.1 unnamed protein product [Triticum turgidum subsp. durum]